MIAITFLFIQLFFLNDYDLPNSVLIAVKGIGNLFFMYAVMFNMIMTYLPNRALIAVEGIGNNYYLCGYF